jgi:hypothetical protein
MIFNNQRKFALKIRGKNYYQWIDKIIALQKLELSI